MNAFVEHCYDELAELADRPITLTSVDEFPSFVMFQSRDHTWAFCSSCGGSCLRLDAVPAAGWVLDHQCPVR